MTHLHKINELLAVSQLNRKKSDLILNQILVDICFELMLGVSTYFYTNSTKQAEYTSFCGIIFTKVNEAIKEAHRSNTYEEYEEAIKEPIIFVSDIVNKLSSKHSFIENQKGWESPELLKILYKENKKIYTKFFVRKRKVRKNVK